MQRFAATSITNVNEEAFEKLVRVQTDIASFDKFNATGAKKKMTKRATVEVDVIKG